MIKDGKVMKNSTFVRARDGSHDATGNGCTLQKCECENPNCCHIIKTCHDLCKLSIVYQVREYE